MRPKDGQPADWRNAAAYAPLLDAGRSLIAWEWLRRDPSYRAAAWRALASVRQETADGAPADRWGLHEFEPPELGVPHARPIWCSQRLASVLPVLAAGPGAADDTFDFDGLTGLGRIVRGRHEQEHLLLSDGLRAIRLDVLAGTVTQGPVQLRYLLGGFASAERTLLTLRRLIALQRTGRFSRSLHPREPRARRWVLLLRAHDASAAGADQRAIAETLLSRNAREPRWRTAAPSLRSQAQRLVRGARRMAAGGYLDLL